MSWILKKHVSKIFHAFKRNKDRIYKEDIDALKSIDEFIDESSKNYVNGNLLFAKLLCIYLRQNVHYYKDVKMAIRELNFQFSMSLDRQIEILTYDMNLVELSKQETPEGVLQKLDNPWTKELVEKSFYNSANDLLKDVNNYS